MLYVYIIFVLLFHRLIWTSTLLEACFEKWQWDQRDPFSSDCVRAYLPQSTAQIRHIKVTYC